MKKEFRTGIALGREHFAKIVAMGDRWKRRRVPIFIRDFLLVPYFFAEAEGYLELFVIQFPINANDKVHFVPFARSVIDEKELTQISYCEK